MLEVGSRGYQEINYKESSLISGVDYNIPMHIFKDNTIIVRSDLINFCVEYMTYKFGFTGNPIDVALVWSVDTWKYPNDKVCRDSLDNDTNSAFRIISSFKDNFLKSNAKKINY